MTFSANPARTTLRDRLRRLPGPQRALLSLLVTALALMACGAVLALFLVRAVIGEQTAQFGSALAATSAERAAEYLVHNDLVSLSVITGDLSRLPGVVGVTVYDRRRQPLAQSGLVQATPDTLVASADILTEESELRGSVEILLDPYASLPALGRFDYSLLGWLGFSIALLLVVARAQREALALPSHHIKVEPAGPPASAVTAPSAADPAPDATPVAAGDTESPLAHVPDGPMLRIDIVNYATLEQRLAPRVFAELIALYDDTLARACTFYQGQVIRPIDHQCLVAFPQANGNDADTLFRAVCCAQLFFGVVRELNAARRGQGNMTMQFTAALHHDPALGLEERAIVTWEICTQAGTAGRLTVTDTITDDVMLGERLVIDGNHRHVLQIELPAAGDGGTARLQDVLALGVLRLADPYEELLARQVKRLSEPAAA